MDNKPVGNFTKIDNGDEKLYSFGDDGKLKVMQKWNDWLGLLAILRV